ncbi:MAG: SH3 domain-containing protein [Sulfurovum sp.]|nr:SH3 domain-containing protein [Sulfurovum sp.]MDD3499335.1 SH3 domain-containing protein [Sulfurovum sp.]
MRKTIFYSIVYFALMPGAVAETVYKPMDASVEKSIRQIGDIYGRLEGDIDKDGKTETIAWKKFLTADRGDYYQLLVFDDDGSLLWKGPEEEDEGNPYIYSSLDIGISLPELLMDIDNDGYTELLAPELQSDVSPVYYRKLRWRGSYFEPLLSNALMLTVEESNRFVWKRTSKPYGTWVSKLTPYGDGLVKADVTVYQKDQSVGSGVALLQFDREGANVYRWIEPLPAHKVIGTVYGLDPYGDGFLSIRKYPNATEIGRLYNGDKVEILDRSGKWFKIRAMESGIVGWSHSNWIRTD